MAGEVLYNWIEEGFSLYGKAEEDKIKNESENSNPKPLFLAFIEDIDFTSTILSEHLTVTANTLHFKDKLFQAANIHEEEDIDTSDKDVLQSEIKAKTLVEFKRKLIFLRETETFSIFEMPDKSVLQNSIDYENTINRNDRYKNSLSKRLNYPSLYEEQAVQTSNPELVDKQTETTPDIREHKYCMVNDSLMQDQYYKTETSDRTTAKVFEVFEAESTKFHDYNTFLECQNKYEDLLPRFKRSLYVTEKALNYNTKKSTILSYSKNEMKIGENETESHSLKYVPKTDIVEQELLKTGDDVPYLHHHLSLSLEKLGKNYFISSIEVNSANPNIFACGYSLRHQKDVTQTVKGYILCWNIKKCGFPEKIFETREAVSSLEFSKSYPFLIAVGMHYGIVAIFDICKTGNGFLLDNYLSEFRPTGTIKSVRWMKKKYALGKEVEVLLSLSLDGTINNWNLCKTLEGYILRTVKRSSELSGEKQKRMVLAVNSTSLCMAIKPDNNDVLAVGTIEGQALIANIHDPINYLHTFDCHNGPVYDLKWSPLVENVFVTCSLDRSIHFWECKRSRPSNTLILADIEAITQFAWSNISSTVFAFITQTKLFIFDFAISLHNAVVRVSLKDDITYSSIAFSTINNWFFAGRSDGTLDIYELLNVSESHENQAKALKAAFFSRD